MSKNANQEIQKENSLYRLKSTADFSVNSSAMTITAYYP
jgi:hypothetical protein